MIKNPIKLPKNFGKLYTHIPTQTNQLEAVSDRLNANRGWHEVGEKRCYFKSKWEHRYALYLDWLVEMGSIADWAYEPKTFWFEGVKCGCVSYKPDFYVIEWNREKNYWVEVKGYMDPKSATKIKRFRKYFPDERLLVVDKKWFSKNTPKLKGIIKDWG